MATRPRPFVPSFLRAALSGSRPLQLTFSQVADTNIKSTSSFIYDPPGAGLKSTQQLNVDWSQFQNHTFFMSAEAKVNLAFDQIVNGYPFDGTRAEVERFFEKLTGFDSWVFDQFPKFRGQLAFNGTASIAVKDHRGALFPELSSDASGGSVLNPKDGASLTLEMQVFVPSGPTVGTQAIVQKLSGTTQGFTLHLEPTGSSDLAHARFSVVSGAFSMAVDADLPKGAFSHVACTFDRTEGVHFLSFFKDGEVVANSRNGIVFNDMSLDASDLTIASGSVFSLGSSTVTPNALFIGTIDELRIFHEARTTTQLNQYAQKSIFADDALRLYYRFNEPTGSLVSDPLSSTNAIVLDGSGNSLHAIIDNFTSSMRQDAVNDPLSKMVYEKDQTAPVLFPAHPEVVALNTLLLTSASSYDSNNPNLITRLVPQHYLLEGAAREGFDEVEGGSGTPYGGQGVPGQGQLSSVQLLLSFLYIYARFFDELKLFVDAFRNLNYVNYDPIDTAPDNMLVRLSEQFGFHLPPLFNDATMEQYVRADNVDRDFSSSEFPLRHVQNELLRRVLVNMPDVLRSKGTQHSIKSFLRSVGIDPENSLRFRESGGPTVRQLSFARETKTEPDVMAAFTTGSYATSPFLSASRIETGFPSPAGTMVNKSQHPPHGISNAKNDGLLTSGSWTVEGIYRWTPTQLNTLTSATQSLARLCVTGSAAGAGLVANLLAVSSSLNPKLVLYLRPGTSASSPVGRVELPMPDAGIFTGDRWSVSFGVERNDNAASRVSSSYFIRAATQNAGQIVSYQSTSSFFFESPGGEPNSFRSLASTSSVSGAFLAIGQGQAIASGSSSPFLNSTAFGVESRVTDLTAQVARVRFWSRALSEGEWKEHVRNYRSTGVEDPSTNWNYSTSHTGSWGRLRLDAIQKQEIRQSTNSSSVGRIDFLDFSQNNMALTGSNFPIEQETLQGEIFDYSFLSPVFDEAVTSEKIRIRGFQRQGLIDETPWADTAPVYEIVKSEEPTDNVKFSIDFSLTDALDRDIISIFATLDAIDNAIGAPELVFSPDYPDLERLRDVYFNRIGDKLNFQAFFEFFRWFDGTIGTFIEQLVPRKTAFKGTNFVVESHMLERHRATEYQFSEQYLGDNDRARIQDRLLLQQIVGALVKF